MPAPGYPHQADRTIRNWAGHPMMPDDVGKQAIETLDKVLRFLFGDAGRVQHIAREWADDRTLTEVVNEVGTATTNVAAYWGGPAADAYKSYSGHVQQTIKSNDRIFDTLGDCLQKCSGKVMDTYKAAIKFIGDIAAKLSRLVVDVPLAFVPGVDVLELTSIIDDAKDFLQQLVNSVTNLINDAVDVVKGYNTQVTRLMTQAGNFQLPPEPASAAELAGNWHVKKSG